MEKKTITASKIAEIAGKVVALLEPFLSPDRQKIITGALAILGENHQASGSQPLDSRQVEQTKSEAHPPIPGLSPRAKSWAQQNGLTVDQIQQVFDISPEGATLIASEAPGANGREKTVNAYVLLGLSRFLSSGESSFDDSAARELCSNLGCYDRPNHSTIMSKSKGNLLTGSKGSGWKVTAPGLKHGAEIVKQLTKPE